MTTDELKQTIAKHFDYSSNGTGQFFKGSYFTPKHESSLEDLLEELDVLETPKTAELEKDLLEATEKIENLTHDLRESERENDRLETMLEAVKEAVGA